MKKKQEYIQVLGSRVHNLKNIDVKIPRNQLVVITGLSGSGKSSLAFDTIYAEGQRRYIETFSAYARQFLGNLERPDVDKIDGLSPVIAIEQKTTNRSPRSTVGTITEIYDFLRLLFARVGTAYSFHTNEKMVQYSDEKIQDLILQNYNNQKINILSPTIKSRKGHYRELFEQIAKQGFVRVRVDGEIIEIQKGMRLDRYKTHDIEIVIDRIKVSETSKKRLAEAIKIAMYHGENVILIVEQETKKARYFSRNLMCPTTGIAYNKPEPNSFSFNSPKGACPKCNGLGTVNEVSIDKIFPDKSLSIQNGGIAPIGEAKNTWIFKQLKTIGQKFNFNLQTPIKDISKNAMDVILYGGKDSFDIESKLMGVTQNYQIEFEGIEKFIKNQYEQSGSSSIKRWAKGFMNENTCSQCNGTRLKKESLFFKINGKNIGELSQMDIIELAKWFKNLQLSKTEQLIGTEILKEIKDRIQFLLDVGLDF